MRLSQIAALGASVLYVNAAIEKREPKNVAQLDSLYQAYEEDHHQKRKNVANIANLEHLLQEEQESVQNDKREAYRIVDVKSIFELEKEGHKEKRSQKIMTLQGPLIENVLTQVRDVSVIAAYLRDLEFLGQLKDAPFALIIAPTDDALANKLDGHKPWEFPRDPENEKHAEENIADFVKAHLVVSDGDVEQINDEVHLHSLGGQKVAIRHEAATDTFSVKLGGNWTKVLAVYRAEDGAVLVIDDVFVKP